MKTVRLIAIAAALLSMAHLAFGQARPGYNANLPGIINVRDAPYGAKNDNATDNAPAINAAIQAACSLQGGGAGYIAPTVYIPPSAQGSAGGGIYDTCSPIIINCAHGINLSSLGNIEASIVSSPNCATVAHYPMIFIEPSGYAAGLGTITATSLATGSGSALSFASSPQNHFYNLSQMYVGGNANWLNGLSAFSVEFYYNFPAQSSGSTYAIVASGGSRNGVPANFNPSFETNLLQNASNATLEACVILSVGGRTCATGTVSNSTTYEAQVSYDGTNLRLFNGVPGSTVTLLATTAGTGTVVQNPEESFLLGEAVDYLTLWGESSNSNNQGYLGKVDSIRFSNIARNTTAYTAPTTKFATDSHTLGLINGTKFTDAFLVTDTPVAYLPAMVPVNAFPGGSGPTYSEISGLNVYNYTGGDALEIIDLVINGKVIDSGFGAADGAGIRLYNYAYEWSFENDQISGDLGGLLSVGVSTVHMFNDNFYTGNNQQFMIGLKDAGGSSFDTIYLNPTSSTIAGFDIMDQAGTYYENYNFKNIGIDAENGGNPIAFMLGFGGNYNFEGGVITDDIAFTPGAAPVFDINPINMMGITLTGTSLDTNSSAPEIFKFETNFSGHLKMPLRCINCNYNVGALSTETTVPISTDATQVLIQDVSNADSGTVAQQYACNSYTFNREYSVNDCSTPCTFGAPVCTGGGSGFCHYRCNGSAWVQQ